MSKEFSYYNTDSFIDDLQELVSLDLSQSNVHIDTHVTTSNILADGVVYSSTSAIKHLLRHWTYQPTLQLSKTFNSQIYLFQVLNQTNFTQADTLTLVG